jgi:isoleucyl-tRNA synthetase
MTTETDKTEFYKQTVFLPKTDFPMRGDLPQREPEILAQWQKQDLFTKQRVASKDKPKWILHWGPPYANGRAHLGHCFSKSLKDVVNRSYQMLGYDAPMVPGWDCHGLPIEWKIEEKYRTDGKDKDAVDINTFRKECREFAQSWADVQSQDFQRVGVMADWQNPYMTMDYKSESIIVREIHKFLKNGGLYKGVKPVMWSVVEKTALAEAEVEYREHKSITIHAAFPIIKPSHAALEGAKIIIWTTTPWTLPSNRAVACGAEISYSVYQVTDIQDGAKVKIGERFVVAETLADDVKTHAKIAEWHKIANLAGNDIAGTLCAHPLRGQGYEFDVPVLLGDFVTADTGTGFVHIAPSHGEDDFYLGKASGLEITDNVTDDGKYREHVPLFAGLEVYTSRGELGDGNFAVLKAFDTAGALVAKGSLRHEYPHSWRSKAPLIFRTTPQWFISMDTNNLRDVALKAIADTRWVPASGENRITSMVANRPDWCISRQRSWGVPIALFVDKKTQQPLKDETVLNRIVEIFETEGCDAWFARSPQDFLGDAYNASDFDQVMDIVDVWFESGCTHAFVLEDRFGAEQRADLYLEGSDQHRGWFHSSLLESCGTRGQAPYKTVLTHGFVMDEKGYKMSKSLGNVIDPHDMIVQYGADILRLWAITSDYGEDVRLGKDNMKLAGDLYRRIRNTFRFLLGALDGFTLDEKLNESEYPQMPELERLTLHWLKDLDQELRTYIEAFEFSRAAQRLHHFCTNELSSLYFDIRKDCLYCDRPDSFERRACRTVLYHVLECLSAWFAPILPFTTEDVWNHRPAALWRDVESVHLRTFPTLPKEWINSHLAKKFEAAFDVRRVILGALEPKRVDKTIGSSLEAHPIVYVSSEIAALLNGVDIAELAITSQATMVTDPPPADAFSLNDVDGVAVVFQKALGKKCQRSWKILPDVGSDPDYPDLSKRDADAVRYFLSLQTKAA